MAALHKRLSHVITKFSQMGSLPHFLTHVPPQARFARQSSAINRAVGRSVWENLDLGRWYRPHCVRSVLATSVKILPYRPPARLIRAKLKSRR